MIQPFQGQCVERNRSNLGEKPADKKRALSYRPEGSYVKSHPQRSEAHLIASCLTLFLSQRGVYVTHFQHRFRTFFVVPGHRKPDMAGQQQLCLGSGDAWLSFLRSQSSRKDTDCSAIQYSNTPLWRISFIKRQFTREKTFAELVDS